MIIEIGGGEGGFKEYLEHGRKVGRDLHRDDLDQRIPLFGDLDVFELSTSYEGDGKKYDHISLSFAENFVSDKMLQKAVDEFRDHALAAYPEEQRHRIAFYAEAHRPKILSHINAETGEEETRLTHIHIGIGRRDLLTGKSVEVLGFFGKKSDNLKYIDAFQESFNSRHGFSSPKDNPKITPENAASTLARYTGSSKTKFGSFNQGKFDLESTLQNEIIEQNITTWKGLEKLLSKHGEVSKMNVGKFNECYRIKPSGDARAVRLKGQFFMRQFVERPTDEKITALMNQARDVYLEQMQPKKAPEYTDPLLKEWREITAREIRYIHKSSSFYKNEYKPADEQKRKELLNYLERNSHAKPRTATDNRREKIAAARGSVPGLPIRNMDGIQKRTAMLLQSHDGLDVSAKHETARNSLGLRQADQGRAGSSSVARKIQPSSVIARVQSDLLDVYEQASVKEKYSEIGKNIDCSLLLNSLSHSHKINPKHYSFTQAKNGSPRIQCGSRALSPSDFLMKELGLSWREAAPILRGVYELQIGKKTIAKREKPAASELWTWFKTERDEAKPGVAAKLKIFDAAARARRQEFAARLKAEQAAAVAGLHGDARKAALSDQKLRAAILKAELAESLKNERNAYQDSLRPPQAIAWRDFLRRLAQAGDENALRELRKIDGAARDDAQGVPGVTGKIIIEDEDEDEKKRRLRSRSAPMSAILRELEQNQKIEFNGDRTYSLQGRAVLRDQGQHIAVLDVNSDEAIAAGLLLGREKFGVLTLTGSDAFQRKAVAVAVAQGIMVKFSDPQLEALRLQLIAERREVRQAPQQPAPSVKSAPKAREQAQRAATTPSMQAPADIPAIPAPAEAEPAHAIDEQEEQQMERAIAEFCAGGKHEGKPIVDCETKQVSGVVVGRTASLVAVASQKEITIHMLAYASLKANGSTPASESLLPGQIVHLKYKADGNLAIDIKEQRQEYQTGLTFTNRR